MLIQLKAGIWGLITGFHCLNYPSPLLLLSTLEELFIWLNEVFSVNVKYMASSICIRTTSFIFSILKILLCYCNKKRPLAASRTTKSQSMHNINKTAVKTIEKLKLYNIYLPPFVYNVCYKRNKNRIAIFTLREGSLKQLGLEGLLKQQQRESVWSLWGGCCSGSTSLGKLDSTG